jgi:hypothetical protein
MSVTQTYNADIKGLYNRINRFIQEAMFQQSSGNSQINEFDQTRLRSYLSACRTYHDHIQGAPNLDLPETHPRIYELRATPEVVELENESLNDIVRLLELCRDELLHSQSARLPVKLISFDSSRFLSIIEKCERFMADYVAVATPLDLPESSPRAAMSGPGKQGI